MIRGVVGRVDGQAFVWVREIPPDTRALERPYVESAQAEFGAPGLDSRAPDKAIGEPVRLEHVYMALNTTETRRAGSWPVERRRGDATETVREVEMTRPASALRVVMESHRAVVLGDPNSDKSMFAQHPCLCLAVVRQAASPIRQPAAERQRALAAESARWTGLAESYAELQARRRGAAWAARYAGLAIQEYLRTGDRALLPECISPETLAALPPTGDDSWRAQIPSCEP